MYSAPVLGWKYLQYFLTAANGKGHGVHSPFVFKFITEVLNDDRQYYTYSIVEPLREALKKNNTTIEVPDFGAGSRHQLSKQRKISEIAQSSLKPKKFSQLLFRMVAYFQPSGVLELGTSLGITTAYLASANPAIPVTSMEGAPAVAEQALKTLSDAGVSNLTIITGNFDDTLPIWLKQQAQIDFAFIDGNHRFEPTMRYFQWLKEKAHDQTVLIFDDIHWSAEMEQAWAEIQADPAVTLTIDLFFIGIVFFRPEQQQKAHFRIRF
jgi:predicted O-methyltransferase YrrM